MSRSKPMSQPLRIAFWTLGCRLNQYDTEIMKASLGDPGVEVVPWNSPADVYVLNSCTVTGKADQECRRLARQIKRRRPGSKVVVTGCYAQTQAEKLVAVPEVDGIIGNTLRERIGRWLPDLMAADAQMVRVEEYADSAAFGSARIEEFDGRSRAFVKVQDGCNLRCAYCLIWQARGPARSRPREDILVQLGMLQRRGYREIVLAGVHLGAFGHDRAEPDGLIELLWDALAEFPDLRLRLSSMHPNEVTPRLLELFRQTPRLRPHLHLSLQSGSDAVLSRMRRPYRRDTAYRAVQAVAATVPRFGIGADFIVGFPGETEQDFADTFSFVRELPLSYLHVFRYSRRPGTPAADLPGQVAPETITLRSRRLRQLAAEKQAAFLQSLLGKVREAVVESQAEQDGWRHATTDNYATVLVPQHLQPGSLALVEPTGLREGRLYAEVVAEIDAGSGSTEGF